MKIKDHIYREDAIKALHEEWDGGWLEVTGEWIADNCEAVLNKLPSADRPSDPHDITYINALKNRIRELEAKRPQGWIPCSERLPNEGEVVLVCMRIESHKAEWEEQRSIEFGRISSDRYDLDGTGWEWLNESGADYWQGDWNNSILAWMPLPKPYKGQEG